MLFLIASTWLALGKATGLLDMTWAAVLSPLAMLAALHAVVAVRG